MREKICISETSQTKSACASLQSDQSLLIPLTELKNNFKENIDGRRSTWSECANAQAGLGMRC